MPTWAIEKVGKLIAKHRTKARREANQQYVFESALGFKRLPEKLESKPGEFVPRADSTISGFRRWKRDLQRKRSPALRYADKAIAMMEPHTQQKGRITWAEVLEKESRSRVV
jgi:hypothetical protein